MVFIVLLIILDVAFKRKNWLLDFSHDKNTYEIKDQYMFGPSIMVKPVTKSMYFNNELTASKTKDEVVLSKLDSVYLPEHKGWYDFWTNDYYKGGQIISKEFPIGIFPLYIKAGSIIPFGPKQQYVDEKKNAPIEIRIYTGDDADFVFYEDEGNNYNYEKGKYNTIHFSWNEEQKKLNIGESTGSFNVYSKDKTFKIVLIEPSVEVKSDMQYRLCNYDGRAVQLELN